MTTETVTADDLKRAYDTGVQARHEGRRRNPPSMANASSDMALAWACGWDAAEAEHVSRGEPWVDDDLPSNSSR